MAALCSLAAAGALCAAGASVAAPVAPPEHRRGPEQTFLTFPEWYLVHSPAEYAALLGHGEASAFPFFSHIGQFWQAYRAVTRETSRYPFNAGYHLMVGVIGTSTTLDYGLKGLYEATVGRIAEATRSGPPNTPEEAFAAKAARDYVDFIRVDPWYLFDFRSRFGTLWTDVPLSGSNLVRRLERRFLLTTEYLVKEGYARLIKLGTRSLYEAPKSVTFVVLSREPVPDAGRSEYRPQPAPAGVVAATIPRYQGFTDYARWLAGTGVDFREVAGNDGEILVSLLAPPSWTPATEGVRTLFVQAMLTQPEHRRVVVTVPVGRLGSLLREESSAVRVEHVYDF